MRCNNCVYGQWKHTDTEKCKKCKRFDNYKPKKEETIKHG